MQAFFLADLIRLTDFVIADYSSEYQNILQIRHMTRNWGTKHLDIFTQATEENIKSYRIKRI